MRSPAKCAAWLLPFLLAGCIHLPFHKHPPLVPLSQVPSELPSQPIDLASIELPPPETVIPAKPIYNIRVHEEPMKPPARHRKPASPQEIPNPQEVAADTNPAVSAIGQLSSGDPANFRQQTEDSIAAIERGLNGMNRTLNDSEQKTADHIREFLKQARAALASGDVDGAHTLAAKARVLLDELTK
jgi:hypothetical protein